MHITRSVVSMLALVLMAGSLSAQPGLSGPSMRKLPPFPDVALHTLVEQIIEQMDGFHGDSAMALITKALSRIDPSKQLEERHYLLAYRAEVLYYEGLFNEAIRDLDQAYLLAQTLKDSTLLANACNLKGILHENIQDSREALPHMRQALHWFPDHPAARYPVSELYHIHGNLGSHLTVLGELDSAARHLGISLELANAAHAQRAKAVAWWGLANIEVLKGDPLQALTYYDRSWALADSAKDHDIGVDALVGRGLALAHAERKEEALLAMGRASDYLRRYRAQVGLVTQRNFAKQASRAFHRLGDLNASITSLAEWHRIDSTITANNIRSALHTQARLLKADSDLEVVRLERERVAEQLANAKRTRLWVIMGSVLTIAALSIIYLVNSSRQRHKRRLAEVEAVHALQERTIAELRVREQVSRDLHDDLGVGLSALKLRSEMNLRQDPQGLSANLLREQAATAEELITSMRHIIWALQDDQGSLDDLVAYILAHARSYLDAHGLELVSVEESRWPDIALTTQQRRNIFLVVKEALHNVVKHAHARQVIQVIRWDSGLHIEIVDDGRGLPQGQTRNGNGMGNMKKRALQVGATLRVEARPDASGTMVTLFVPFVVNES